MTLNTGLRLICLLGISLWTTITLAQDMYGWSDKTVCRLVEQNRTPELIGEAKNRKLNCVVGKARETLISISTMSAEQPVNLQLSEKLIHYDNFSGLLKSEYMKIQIPDCVGQCTKYNAISYQNENENEYISLTSKQGQLSVRNSGDEVWNKDRVKLAITLPFQGKQINQKTIWYGFRAKFPEGVKSINAQNITFTEIHQIEKSKDRKHFCTKGMFWRYNFENNLKTWAGVTTGSGEVLKKTFLGDPVITDRWHSFKIGVHFDDTKGWVTARRNGKKIFHYDGNTYSMLWSGNPKCNNRKPLEYIVQIGVYRGIKFKLTPDDYHTKTDTIQFDDFIISEAEADVDQVFIKSSR